MPPIPPLPPRPVLPRIITYYQTHHDASGKHISLLPLLTEPEISVTHIILAAIHLNSEPTAITLNDHHPDHDRFHTLWAELRLLQASGIKVLAMLGGAAAGSYTRLDGSQDQFESYYAPLRDLIRARALDGLDLDVEEPMSLAGIIRLIDRLRSDFGPHFTITLAPVAAALLHVDNNLSGFDYEALEVLRGREIAWYNTQFYCGWGDLTNTSMYDLMLGKGWPPDKVVIGLVTNPANGSGYVAWEPLAAIIYTLSQRNSNFAGVMGWEYFNSLPGEVHRPWEWARNMTFLLRQHALSRPEATKVQQEPDIDPDPEGTVPLEVPRDFEYFSDGDPHQE